MTRSKKILLGTGATLGAVVLASSLLTGSVSADDSSDWGPATFANRIAERFGLNQDEVQGVFDEVHQERHQARQVERESHFQDALSQAVANGTLTQEQSSAFEAKHQEIQAEREANIESWKDLSPEERQSFAQDRHQEMEQWLSDNGIDTSVMEEIMGGFGEGRGSRNGEGRGMGKGMQGMGR